jgi:hypothetical protein
MKEENDELQTHLLEIESLKVDDLNSHHSCLMTNALCGLFSELITQVQNRPHFAMRSCGDVDWVCESGAGKVAANSEVASFKNQ